MVFSDKENILIKNLYQLNGYKDKAMELTNEFPHKSSTTSSSNRLLIKFRNTGAVNRLTGIAADHEVYPR